MMANFPYSHAHAVRTTTSRGSSLEPAKNKPNLGKLWLRAGAFQRQVLIWPGGNELFYK